MKNSDAVFSGSIPATYDKYLGPVLFEPYAKDITARIAPSAPAALLEVAAGTGIVTRRLVDALPQTSIVATDLNTAMVEYAAAALERANLTWRQADALDLPFPDETFDVVVCQFGVMFFPDKAKGFREARRVLRQGGRYYFSVWDRIEANEFAHETENGVAQLFPGNAPRFLSRTPYGYNDTAAIAAELVSSGFTDVSCETVGKTSGAQSPREPALGFVTGSPLRAEVESRDPARVDDAVHAAAQAIEMRFGTSEPRAKMQAYVFTATR